MANQILTERDTATKNQSHTEDSDTTVVGRDFQGNKIVGEKQEENYIEHIFRQ